MKAAGLVDTLQGAGPSPCSLRPTCLSKLPAGTVDTLLKTENKPTLAKVLTYPVVGRLTAQAS